MVQRVRVRHPLPPFLHENPLVFDASDFYIVDKLHVFIPKSIPCKESVLVAVVLLSWLVSWLVSWLGQLARLLARLLVWLPVHVAAPPTPSLASTNSSRVLLLRSRDNHSTFSPSQIG